MVFSLSIVTRLVRPEVLELNVLKFDAEVFGDALTAGEHREIFQHRLATIAEARGFHRRHLQGAAELVHDQGRERFAFHVFRDDEERTSSFRYFLKQRQHILQARDFLLVDEDVGVFEDGFHRFGVGHEVGREIALVELHALDDVEAGFDRLGFFHRDRSVLAHFVHRVGDDFADRAVPVGRDSRDLCDFRAFTDLLRDLRQLRDNGFDRLVDAALERSRVGAGRDIAETFLVDGLSENGRSRGAVTSNVRSLGSDFADELGAHVFVRILELDFLGHGHTILGDRRAAEFLVEDDVAAARSEGRFHSARELLDAAEKRMPRILIKL